MSRRQLIEAGVGEAGVSRRVSNGRLFRVHRGVYAVGHLALSDDGRWMSAVLACGHGAVLSHRSAAALWRLLKPVEGPVEVSLATAAGRGRRAGIRLHRRPRLDSRAVTGRRNIPVTTPAQTIADLRGAVTPPELRRAIRQAEVQGLATGLEERATPTRSELEEAFLHLCRRRGLPEPEVNVPVGRYEVDFLWPQHRLIVETDGYRYHRGAQAFEDDHERTLQLASCGYTVRRFSYRQVTDHPARVASAVRHTLRTTAPPPSQIPN